MEAWRVSGALGPTATHHPDRRPLHPARSRQPRQPKFRPRRSEMSQGPRVPIFAGMSKSFATACSLRMQPSLCAPPRLKSLRDVQTRALEGHPTPNTFLNTLALKSRRFLGSLALTVGPLSFMVSRRDKLRLQIKVDAFWDEAQNRRQHLSLQGTPQLPGTVRGSCSRCTVPSSRAKKFSTADYAAPGFFVLALLSHGSMHVEVGEPGAAHASRCPGKHNISN